MKYRGQWLRALFMGVLIELIKGNNMWTGPTQVEFPGNNNAGGIAFTGNTQGNGYLRAATPDQWKKSGSEGTRPYDSWGPSDRQIKSTEDINYQTGKTHEDGLGLKNIKPIDQSLVTNNHQNKNDGWSVADAQEKEHANRKVKSTNTPYDGSFTDLGAISNVAPGDAKRTNGFVSQEIVVTGWKPLQDGITLTAHEITNSDWNKLQGNGMLTSPEITVSGWNPQYAEEVRTHDENDRGTKRGWQPDQSQQHGAEGWTNEGNGNNNEKWANKEPNQQTDANIWVDKGVQENVDAWNPDDKRQDGFNNERPVQEWNPSGNAQTTGGGWSTQENVNDFNSRDQQENFKNEHYGPVKDEKHEGSFPNTGEGWSTANKLPNDMGWSNDNPLNQVKESWNQENEEHHSYNEENRHQSDNTWQKNAGQSEFIDNEQFNGIPFNPSVNQPNNGDARIHEDNIHSNIGRDNNEKYGPEGLPPSNTFNGPENTGVGISNFQPPEEKYIGATPNRDSPENFPGAVFPPTENSYGNQGVADNVGKPIGGTSEAELAKGDIGSTAPDFPIRQPQGNYKGSDGSYHTGDYYGETSHENTIPGIAGQDYPNFLSIPNTAFDCKKQEYPGYFADLETGCQVYHVCQTDGRHDSFLCPTGTIFNQKLFTCDWWFNYDCSSSTEHYSLNLMLYREGDAQGNYKGSHYPGGRVNGAQFPPQSGHVPTLNAPHQSGGSTFDGQVTYGNGAENNGRLGTSLGGFNNPDGNSQVNNFPIGQNEQKYGIQVGGNDGGRNDYNSLTNQETPVFKNDPKNGVGNDYNSYNDEGRQNLGTDYGNERGIDTGRDYNSFSVEERQKSEYDTDYWEQKHLSNEEWNNADNYDSGNAGGRWNSDTQNGENVDHAGKWTGPLDTSGLWTPEGTHETSGGNANEYHKNSNDGSLYPARDQTGAWEGDSRQIWDSQARIPEETKINEHNTVFVDKRGSLLSNEDRISGKVPDWNKINGNAEVRIDNRNRQWIGAPNQNSMPGRNIHSRNDGDSYKEGKYDTPLNVREDTAIPSKRGFEQSTGHISNNKREIPAGETVYGSNWNPQSDINSGIRRVWEDTDMHKAGELGDKTVNKVKESSNGKKENVHTTERSNSRIGEHVASVDKRAPNPKIDGGVTGEGIFVGNARHNGGPIIEELDRPSQYKIRENKRDRTITPDRDEKFVIPMRLVVADANIGREGEVATQVNENNRVKNHLSLRGTKESLSRGNKKYAMPMEALRILPELYGFRDSSIGFRMNGNVDKSDGKYIISVKDGIRKDSEQFIGISEGGHDTSVDSKRSENIEEENSSRQGTVVSERENVSRDDRRYNLPIREEKGSEGHGELGYNGNWQELGHGTVQENWRGNYNHDDTREQYHQESSERHYVSVTPEVTKPTYHGPIKEIPKSIYNDPLREKVEEIKTVIPGHTGTVQRSNSKGTKSERIIAEFEDSDGVKSKVIKSSVLENPNNASKKLMSKNLKMNLSNDTKMGIIYGNQSVINNKTAMDNGNYSIPNFDILSQNGTGSSTNKLPNVGIIDKYNTGNSMNTSSADSKKLGNGRRGKSKRYKVIIRNTSPSSTNWPNPDRRDELISGFRSKSKTTPFSTSFS